MENAARVKKGMAFGSLATTLIASVVLLPNVVNAASNPHYTINIQLSPNTGTINTKDNQYIKQLTQQYEKMHPNISVNWLPVATSESNLASFIVTRAAAHAAPDVVWTQYGPVNSFSIPKGILLNLKPYLDKPSPYAKGYKTWLDTWQSGAIPYMQNADGGMYVIVGSSVATEVVYNKADFKKAGIKNTPTTFSAWLADMAKLKKAGITPLMFGTGAACNPSWFERKFASSLLNYEISKFNVNHSQILTGLDFAVGVKRGIISMKNPRYAEGWKLLGELSKYNAPGASQYDACATLTASSPPLPEMQPFVANKFAMAWLGSWDIPELNSLGFGGKFGFFSFPTINKAATKFSNNVNVTGTVGGPNGSGEYSVATQQADSSMTPQKTKWVINFLQWLYAPQHEAKWILQTSSGSYVPLIKGAAVKSSESVLLPKKMPPPTVDAVTNDALTSGAETQGLRLIQAYVGGQMSYTQFAQQWQQLLQTAAEQWAQANNVNLNKY